MPIRFSHFILCVSLAVVVTACSPEPDVEFSLPVTIELATYPSDGPVRLADQLFKRRIAEAFDPVPLPSKTAWRPSQGTRVAIEDNTIEMQRARGGDPSVSVDIDLAAREITELEIEVQVTEDTDFRLRWKSDYEPNPLANPGVIWKAFGDSEFQRYTVPLDALATHHWAGRVTRLVLSVTTAAPVRIRDARLHYSPPDAPLRIELGSQTHEAIPGDPVAWTLTVPEYPMFEMWLGTRSRENGEHLADGVRFVVSAEIDEGAVGKLVDKVISLSDGPSWRHVRMDLQPYEGRRLTLHFSAEPEGNVRGREYAYWGSPIIYNEETPLTTTATPVVLISCDTTRADHFSCYGYHRETTPNIDAFARDAVLFENAITPETWTLPSHVTMLTGLFPQNHNTTPHSNLAESVVTLPEALRDAGYQSAGYTGSRLWFYPWRGLAHGFDLYNISPSDIRPVHETLELANQWVDDRFMSNFFLFFHNMDMHARPDTHGFTIPYSTNDPDFYHFTNDFDPWPTFDRDGGDTPDGEAFLSAVSRGDIEMTPEEQAFCIAMYDDCIRMVDDAIGRLFQNLRKDGMYDRALIIVTADHGEEFGEHGKYGHGSVYEGCARIPLIVKFPGGEFAGERFEPVVQLTDLYPTVLDVIGLAPNNVDGKSLYGMLKGEVEPHTTAYIQRIFQQAARDQRHKFVKQIVNGDRAFYDLGNDPTEQKNLYGEPSEVCDRLEQASDRFFSTTGSPAGWHFKLEAMDPEATAEMTLTTDDRFEVSKLTTADRVAHPTTYSRHSRLIRHTWGDPERKERGDRFLNDELIVRTAGPDAKVRFNLASSVPIRVVIGEGEAFEGTTHTFLLDPESAALPPDDSTAVAVDSPTLRVWFVFPEASQTAAKDLSEEDVEDLEALGYIGE